MDMTHIVHHAHRASRTQCITHTVQHAHSASRTQCITHIVHHAHNVTTHIVHMIVIVIIIVHHSAYAIIFVVDIVIVIVYHSAYDIVIAIVIVIDITIVISHTNIGHKRHHICHPHDLILIKYDVTMTTMRKSVVFIAIQQHKTH